MEGESAINSNSVTMITPPRTYSHPIALGLAVLVLHLMPFDAQAQPRYVTLTFGSEGTTGGQPVQLTVAPDEVAELVSYPASTGWNSELRIQVGGGTHSYWPQKTFQNSSTGPVDPLFVAGPATITLRGIGGATDGNHGLCTFRILPDATSIDRTVLLPPSTNLTSVTLESSTNLVSWTTATNGVYGPVPAALFLRIKVAAVHQ